MMSSELPTWQQALSQAITELPLLYQALELKIDDVQQIFDAKKSFALRVPYEFVARMEKDNPYDPLLLQVLPQAQEMIKAKGFCEDPVGDLQKNPVPGLLHKYPGRVLLTLTGACAVNCRYCFRRHFPYADIVPSRENWQAALDYIRHDLSIREVILSGGDPLLLKDNQLAEFSQQLETIAHLKRLRIHTRLPVVIPQRVTNEWIAWMVKSRFQIVVVLHCNHPNEIDHTLINALKPFQKTSITLLNQSVLLKNINDNAEVLAQLSERLFEAGVLPYYLHLLDKVQGAAHFDVSEATANKLLVEIKQRLPGFLVPKLSRETAGLLSKQF